MGYLARPWSVGSRHKCPWHFYRLGRAHEATAKTDEAIGSYQAAITIIERQRATVGTESERIGFLRDKEVAYRRIVPLLAKRGDFAAAFQYAERSRSRALVDLLGNTRLSLASATESEAFAANLRKRSEVDVLLDQRSLGPAQVRWLDARLRDLQTGPGSSRSASREFQSLTAVQVADIDEVASVLGDSAALVSYFVGDEDLTILVLQDGRLRGWTRPVNRDDLASAVAGLRRATEQPPAGPGDDVALDLGRQLFTILWEPVAASIEKPVVYVVPHGPLHYLPFSALHDGTTYLLARHPLAVTPSATVLTFLKAKGRRPLSDGVVFGNPVTGGAHVDLPHAEQEAVWVGAALPRATVVTRTEATESRAKDLVSTAGIVHFATHGVLDVERPLESALLLAPDSQNDGRLTAREIFGLRLPGTLVVLSACRTGMSQLAAGDELIGLTRAFMYAGARTIVGTLWDISDESTAHLMREFYARLGTESKAQALRSAQLAVRARYPHPFYWAPFLIIGDWE